MGRSVAESLNVCCCKYGVPSLSLENRMSGPGTQYNKRSASAEAESCKHAKLHRGEQIREWCCGCSWKTRGRLPFLQQCSWSRNRIGDHIPDGHAKRLSKQSKRSFYRLTSQIRDSLVYAYSSRTTDRHWPACRIQVRGNPCNRRAGESLLILLPACSAIAFQIGGSCLAGPLLIQVSFDGPGQPTINPTLWLSPQ